MAAELMTGQESLEARLCLPTKGGEVTPRGYVLPDDMRDYRPHHHAQEIGARVWHVDLRAGLWGASQPGRGVEGLTIWLSRFLSPYEERSVLAHELAHVELGHEGRQASAVEDVVDEIAARWLVSEKALRWAHRERPGDVAGALYVDERTLWVARGLWPRYGERGERP